EDELSGEGEDVPVLARVARRLDERLQDVLRRLAVARQQEANPRSAAWAEAKTLLAVANDEATRLRLRDLLRQIAERLWVVVVPRKSYRLCAVQILFQGGARRDYLVVYHAAGNHRPGGWKALSFADVVGADDLDLRRKADVRDLERFLAGLDLSKLI